MKNMGRLWMIGIVAFALACSRGGQANGDATQELDGEIMLDSVQSEHDISSDARQWTDSIIERMTIEEMAGQLIMPAVYSLDTPDAMHLLKKYAADSHIGGVVLLKGNVEAARMIADTLRQMLPAPPFIAIDAEWGLAMRLAGTPEFPRNGKITANADEEALFDYGAELARECRELGINVVLGPVLDVLPEGVRRSGIGSRSFGQDAERAAKLGVAYAKGIESGGVISVAKHFPGHGSADADSHKRLPAVEKTREELAVTDLKPFKEYVGNGLSAIMMGHLYVPALDEEEVPVTVSEKILKGMVRDEMGFQGLIMTDAMNMAGAEGKTAADAIIAGADIVIAPANTEEEVMTLAAAVRSGRLPIGQLKDRVGRVLFYKFMVARENSGSGKIGDTEEAERIIKLLR